MTANKMPEVPAGLLGWLTSYQQDLLQQHERACYLAGIAAARECVPEQPEQVDPEDREWCGGYRTCRLETLANLSALEQGVGK